jgi:hypothetical protein
MSAMDSKAFFLTPHKSHLILEETVIAMITVLSTRWQSYICFTLCGCLKKVIGNRAETKLLVLLRNIEK